MQLRTKCLCVLASIPLQQISTFQDLVALSTHSHWRTSCITVHQVPTTGFRECFLYGSCQSVLLRNISSRTLSRSVARV